MDSRGPRVHTRTCDLRALVRYISLARDGQLLIALLLAGQRAQVPQRAVTEEHGAHSGHGHVRQRGEEGEVEPVDGDETQQRSEGTMETDDPNETDICGVHPKTINSSDRK